MALGDNCQVASDRPHQNQPLGRQSPSHGHENNPHPTPSSNRDQVKEPYPYPHQSQPQVKPTQSSESPLRATGYGYRPNPPLIQVQPRVHQQADVPPPKHGNGYPEPRSNPYQNQPQGVPPPSSKPPLRTTGDPPLIQVQPQVHQQADSPPPKHGNGYPEPRPNRAQVNEHYSSPQKREGGYGGSNGVGHHPPPTEAKTYEDRQQPQEKEAPSHVWGNYQSDQFNVHEHNPPSVTVKPPIPSVNGYPVSKVTARLDPQTHTQSQPYPDFSTDVGGFGRLNGYRRKEMPSGAAGGHGTGHSYEQRSPHGGDERLPVSPADKQSLHVNVNVNVGQAPATPALVHGSGQPDYNRVSKDKEVMADEISGSRDADERP